MIARKSFLLLLFLAASLGVSAQIGQARRDVSIGVSAGVTMNSVSFNPSVSQDMKTSPMFGIALRYNCEKYFTALCGLQMEVNWCKLGWKEDFSKSAHPDYHYTRDMNYITVPIMARMGWGREHKGLLGYIMAGPQLGFLISEKEDMTPVLADTDASISLARRAQYGKAAQNKFDYGITAGVGIEFNTRKAGHFMIDGRYYLGLADIFNNGKADYFGRSANGTITVKFTYLFDILTTKQE